MRFKIVNVKYIYSEPKASPYTCILALLTRDDHVVENFTIERECVDAYILVRKS